MSGDIEFLSGDEFTFTFDEVSKGAFKELFGFDKEIVKKIVDIYNYMAEKRTPNMYLQFESGIKINISIDVSEYRGEVGKQNESNNKD